MKTFLITGMPLSGTKYTAEVFQALDYDVKHEANGAIGTVSFKHFADYLSLKRILDMKLYDPIIHQVRHPLSVMRSIFKVHFWSWKVIYRYIAAFTPQNTMKRAMYAWYRYNALIEKHASYRFRIEDFDNIYPELFKFVGLPVPDRLPDIPKNTNTKRDHEAYISRVTWADLRKVDSRIARHMKNMANRYGYTDC